MMTGIWAMSVLGRPSKKPEIVGPYPEFARLVLQITGDVARSTAAVRAGVSHDTIARMWRGERVSVEAIMRFAEGYKVDPEPLLRAGGHDYLAKTFKTPTPKNSDAISVKDEPDKGEIERTDVGERWGGRYDNIFDFPDLVELAEGTLDTLLRQAEKRQAIGGMGKAKKA